MPRKKSPAVRAFECTYTPVHRRRKKRAPNPNISCKVLKVCDDNRQLYVGRLFLATTGNVFEETWTDCRIIFKKVDGDIIKENAVFEFDSCTAVVTLGIDVHLLKDIVTSKVFAIDFLAIEGELYINLYLHKLPLEQFNTRIGSCIKDVFHSLVIVPAVPEYDNTEESANTNLPEFYRKIRETRIAKQPDLPGKNVQHARLKPELRPYQADAVRWMLFRENQDLYEPNTLHPLYQRIVLDSGVEFYYDPYTGHIELERPVVAVANRGGILADEMGLGKTVEVLACILCNPREDVECDMSKAPSVERIRKRPATVLDDSESSEDAEIIPYKRIKTRTQQKEEEAEEAGSSRARTGTKSMNFTALKSWYDECLDEMKPKPKQPKCTYPVQCVCGHTSQNHLVQCTTCGKSQHSTCTGYQPHFAPFKCSQCWLQEPPVESGATLIVTPISLRSQWSKEIATHVRGACSVLIYEGASSTPLYPEKLRECDIVITTYAVLQNELLFTESAKEFRLRNERKYAPPGCPLTCVKFWRLCLDEAQTVDSPTTKVAEMARKLSAHFRWAVTGTPISKTVSDLYGLIEYLKIEPFNDKITWDHILYTPYVNGKSEQLFNFLSQVLWRSSKDDVLDQINIPKQTTLEHWLDFSAVEQYFYKCEHDASRITFLERIKNLRPDVQLADLDKARLKLVMAPLLSLRQACTYVDSGHTRYLATRKPVNSLKDLLNALIARNVNDSEEDLRLILSSLNGLAGIHQIHGNFKKAAAQYEEVLKLHKRFTEQTTVEGVKVDKLPVIHAMHNLAEIHEDPTKKIWFNSLDILMRNVRQECQEMERSYLAKFAQSSMSCHQESLLDSGAVEKCRTAFTMQTGQWYCDLIDWIFANEHGDELLRRVDNGLMNYGTEFYKKKQPSMNLGKLVKYAANLTKWDTSVARERDKSLDAIDGLYEENDADDLKITVAKEIVKNAMDCHLRPEQDEDSKEKAVKEEKWCEVCFAEKKLKAYEHTLFHVEIIEKNHRSDGPKTVQHNWKDSVEEMVLKTITVVGKSRNAPVDLIKDGETHTNLLESLKKEFKDLRKFWTCLDQQICAQDELDICKIRLTVKEPDQTAKPSEDVQKKRVTSLLKNLDYTIDDRHQCLYQLERHKLDLYEISFKKEEQESRLMLERNIGMKKYLQTLNKREYEGAKPDPCPICKNCLEKQWCIIPCGHSYCLDCMKAFIRNAGRGHYISCCVCRAYHKIGQVSYVQPGLQTTASVPDEDTIQGNFSMKVEGIIRLVLKLRAEDPAVKILVFSTWIPVLAHLKSALLQNAISVGMITNGSNLDRQIGNFKQCGGPSSTVLLLPISLGGKGLNLIEATHVILSEPLLNPAEELQAVGRVHRIGQTKPTFVHKFLIKDTIEEKIQTATKTNAAGWDKAKITLKQLSDLFVDLGNGLTN